MFSRVSAIGAANDAGSRPDGSLAARSAATRIASVDDMACRSGPISSRTDDPSTTESLSHVPISASPSRRHALSSSAVASGSTRLCAASRRRFASARPASFRGDGAINRLTPIEIPTGIATISQT